LKTSKELRKGVNWLKNQITLKRKWYLYAFFLILFIIGSYYYRDAYLFQIGITLFSIAIVYLVMETSNIELRETTEKQIKTLVDNFQVVCSELKNVASRIDDLSKVMTEVKNTILESTLASKTAIAKAEEEKRKRKESIKPKLSFKIEVRGFAGIFGFLDMRHYYLTLWNSGSDALDTIVQLGDKVSLQSYNIGMYRQVDIDFGHVNDFRGIASLSALVQTRDVDRNLYRGNVQVALPQPQWISIQLIEA